MKFLIDMCLPPSWVGVLEDAGWTATHWSKVGQDTDMDTAIMQYAAIHDYILLTHDLDFGTLLALTGDNGPSVVQLRAGAILPKHIGKSVVSAIRQFEDELIVGALITVEIDRARARILPIRRTNK